MCTIAYAENITINWIVDGEQYETPTMCEYSGDVILPTPPTKYGYTFAGWEPNEYLFVEYIEGLNNTQYIDTEIIPNSSITLYIKSKIVSTSNIDGTNELYGGRISTAYVGVTFFINKSNIDMDWFGTQSEDRWRIQDTPFPEGNIYEISIINSVARIKINGVLTYSHKYTTATNSPVSIFINGINNNGAVNAQRRFAVNRIYHFKIDGIADMRPAIRLSDNAVGMYDVIRQRFFENAGTGAFTAGPVIGE